MILTCSSCLEEVEVTLLGVLNQFDIEAKVSHLKGRYGHVRHIVTCMPKLEENLHKADYSGDDE